MKKLLSGMFILTAMLFGFTPGCIPIEPNYETVTIGKQVWMAKNINIETGNSWCYDNDPRNCEIYGRLYDWETAMNVCPSGWHLPSYEEWTKLVDSLGGVNFAGSKMKSTGTIETGTGLWSSPNTGATNSSGWSGYPGGWREQDGSFHNLEKSGLWWSSSEYITSDSHYLLLNYYEVIVNRYTANKQTGMSVRCLRNW